MVLHHYRMWVFDSNTFRHSREDVNYNYHDIDSSPESYRNVSVPQRLLEMNEDSEVASDSIVENSVNNDQESIIFSSINPNPSNRSRKFNFYLRRRNPHSREEEKDWIVVKNDCVL